MADNSIKWCMPKWKTNREGNSEMLNEIAWK